MRYLRTLCAENYGRLWWAVAATVVVGLLILALGLLELKDSPGSPLSFWLVTGLGSSILVISLVTGALGNELHQRITKRWPDDVKTLWKNGAVIRLMAKAMHMALVKNGLGPDNGRLYRRLGAEVGKSWPTLADETRSELLALSETACILSLVRDSNTTVIRRDAFLDYLRSCDSGRGRSDNELKVAVDEVNKYFAGAFREALKRDFSLGGEAWPAICLDISSEMIRTLTNLESGASSDARAVSDSLRDELTKVFEELIDGFERRLSQHDQAVIDRVRETSDTLKRAISREGKKLRNLTREEIAGIRQLLCHGLQSPAEFASRYWQEMEEVGPEALWSNPDRAGALRDSVIGRGEALAQFDKFLEGQEYDVMALIGPPGVGKTRLTMAMAECAVRKGWATRFIANSVHDLGIALKPYEGGSLLLIWDDERGTDPKSLEIFMAQSSRVKRLISAWPDRERAIRDAHPKRARRILTCELGGAADPNLAGDWQSFLSKIAAGEGRELGSHGVRRIVEVSEGNPLVMLHALSRVLLGEEIDHLAEPSEILDASYGALIRRATLTSEDLDALRYMAMLGEVDVVSLSDHVRRSVEKLALKRLVHRESDAFRMTPDLFRMFVIRDACCGRVPALDRHRTLVDLVKPLAAERVVPALRICDLALQGSSVAYEMELLLLQECPVGIASADDVSRLRLTLDLLGWSMHDNLARLLAVSATVRELWRERGPSDLRTRGLRSVCMMLSLSPVGVWDSSPNALAARMDLSADVANRIREIRALVPESVEAVHAEAYVWAAVVEEAETPDARAAALDRVFQLNAETYAPGPLAEACLAASVHLSADERRQLYDRVRGHFASWESSEGLTNWPEVLAYALTDRDAASESAARDAKRFLEDLRRRTWLWRGVRWAKRAPSDVAGCLKSVLDESRGDSLVAAQVLGSLVRLARSPSRAQHLEALRLLERNLRPNLEVARVLIDSTKSVTGLDHLDRGSSGEYFRLRAQFAAIHAELEEVVEYQDVVVPKALIPGSSGVKSLSRLWELPPDFSARER